MQISFIIPAYNEELYIEATIQSIESAAAQTSLNFEIIVVNDNSTDSTLLLAEKMKVKTLTVFNRKISATRNDGAKIASGDVLVFLDADTHVTVKLIQAMLKSLENDKIVGGGANVVFDDAPLYGRLMARWVMSIFSLFNLAAGCFIFCRKTSFELIGGFDEKFYYTEEIDFSKKMKRAGKFIILKEKVITSGRKLKTYSFWQTMKFLFILITHNPKSNKNHSGKEYWYKQRS